MNKDRDLAVKYTKDLSFVYRYVLTHDQQDTVTIREEIEFIGYYHVCPLKIVDGLYKFNN